MSPRRGASVVLLVLALLLGKEVRAQVEVTVRGDPQCPSAAMVRAALDEICPEADWPFETVSVDVSAARLSLTLDEDPHARRDIPAAVDCRERAASIALVVRAWSGELPSRPTSPPALTVHSPALSSARPKTHALEIDGALFYAALWGHAPGAWVGVGRTPHEGGLGFRTFGAYQSAEEVSLAGGQNRLRRLWAGAGPTLHLQEESLFASTDVGLLASFTRAKGDGYADNQSAHTWNLGALADVRAGLQLETIRVWLGVRLLRLFHEESIAIASSPGKTDASSLNAWDLQVGVGIGSRFE
jgi:hypothetical protein